MRFSMSKAAVYGVVMFVALAIGFTISGGWTPGIVFVAAAIGGLIGAVTFGYMMREVSVDVAGATPASVEAAIRSSWALRSFRASDAGGGVVRYARGASVFGDVFTVTTTATGVTLTGAANIMNVVKRRTAGR